MRICTTVLFIADEPHGYHLEKTAAGFILIPASFESGDTFLPQLVIKATGDGLHISGTTDADLLAQAERLMALNKVGELEEVRLAAV